MVLLRRIGGLAAMALTCMLLAGVATAQEAPNLALRELPLLTPSELARVRQLCAADRMPAVKADYERENRRDVERGGFTPQPMPEVDVYCLEILRVSANRGLTADLYVNMALQEQGFSQYHSAEQAQLLRNNESGQTTARILRAALAGQTTYESIAQRTRPLPCPLAFDAGYVWGFRNSDRPQPYELTRAEAEAIARQCYVPLAQSILIQGRTLSAQQAGVYAGAYFGRESAQSATH